MPSLISLSACLLALCSTVPVALAADRMMENDGYPRLVGELLLGTSGFEPGVAGEWRFASGSTVMMIRPEVTISEDGRPGAAASINWIPECGIPDNQSLSFGPRVAYHNSDDSGWEGSLLAIYHINIVPSQNHHHFIEVIGSVGVLEDKRDDNNHTTRFGGTAGVAYGYQF